MISSLPSSTYLFLKAGWDEYYPVAFYWADLVKTCHVIYREHGKKSGVSAHKACLGFGSCRIDCEWQKLFMQTIFTSNLDFNQLISQPLLTLTSCSSYLLNTHSPVSHVAGAPGQHSSLSLVWSQCWIIVICRRNAYPKVASGKSKTNCTELFAFETYSNCWYTPILTTALICCPDTVWVCEREQSALGMLFYLEQWAAFWKVTVSVLPLTPRLLHLTSRCPTMQLRVRQRPPHYSLH